MCRDKKPREVCMCQTLFPSQRVGSGTETNQTAIISGGVRVQAGAWPRARAMPRPVAMRSRSDPIA